MTISRLAWCCACAACGAVVLSAAHAQEVLHVNAAAPPGGDGSSWQAAFADLQDALAAAADEPAPVQIWIAAGTYTPGPPEAGPEATFELISGVQMYGGFAGDEQSLDERDWETNETMLSGLLEEGGPRVHHVLSGASLGEGTVLDGLVIRDGDGVSPSGHAGGGLTLTDSVLLIANTTFAQNSAWYGGAIDSAFSDVTLQNCLFVDNWALYDAGAIDAYGGEWSITDCEFIDQTALYTAAGMRAENVTLTVSNTLFHSNATSGIGWIAAVMLLDSDAHFTDSTFTENYSYGNGGIGSYGGSLALQGCSFVENAHLTVIGDGILEVSDTSFHGNSGPAIGWDGVSTIIESSFIGNGCGASDCFWWGGASLGGESVEIRDSVFHKNGAGILDLFGNLGISAAEMTLVNCRITGGTSAHYGTGGLRVTGSGSLTAINCLIAGNNYSGVRVSGGVQAEFINCTIVDNTDFEETGVGLYVGTDSLAIVRNSILWGNVDAWAEAGDEVEPVQVSGPAQISYSIIQGLAKHDGSGNLGDDPFFADDDGRLAPGSPAIDAGANDFVPDGITTDLDGNPRFVDGTGDGKVVVDMGAFEFQGLLPGDINQDGLVNVDDLLILLAAWGECDDPADCPADLTGDGAVGIDDLLILLADWTFS